VVGGSGHDDGGGKSNSSYFLLYKSAFSGVQSGCFHDFDALKTLEMTEPCHSSLNALWGRRLWA
jgi:hypothetical protein